MVPSDAPGDDTSGAMITVPRGALLLGESYKITGKAQTPRRLLCLATLPVSCRVGVVSDVQICDSQPTRLRVGVRRLGTLGDPVSDPVCEPAPGRLQAAGLLVRACSIPDSVLLLTVLEHQQFRVVSRRGESSPVEAMQLLRCVADGVLAGWPAISQSCKTG
jgi:hypothetical protein